MKTGRAVLKLLSENEGEFLSGEAIAEKLNISRSSVWKSVSELRRQGCDITAVTNKGYMLGKGGNVLSSDAIKSFLVSDVYSVEVRDSVSSTNAQLKQAAENGAPEFTVLAANNQTSGRGRKGRSFYSPPGSGLYMSVLLRPKISAEKALGITTCAAVACARAVERVSDRHAMIKWVNDIYADGKKVCGILTEASVDFEGGGLNYAVLGIGINVLPPQGGFPKDIENKAGSIFENAESGGGMLRAKTAAAVLDEFAALYARLVNGSADDEVLAEYRRRSLVTGRNINIIYPDRTEKAKAVGIDDEFRLIAEKENGEIVHLGSGDVSLSI